MAGAYRGNLVQMATADQADANFWPDTAHATPRGHATGVPEPYPTTDQVYAGTGQEYAGTTWPNDVMVGKGIVLGTPSRSHDGRGGRKMVYSDDQYRADLTALHAEDGQRRYVQHTFTLPLQQASTQVYYDVQRESDPIYGHANNTGAVGPMRGIDGNPQNNPHTAKYPLHGMRPGWERHGPNMDDERRLGRRKYQYQAQPLYERDHYKCMDQPAVPGAGPDIVALPLWKEPGTLTGFKRPALFREPAEVDRSWLAQEQALTDEVIAGGLAG